MNQSQEYVSTCIQVVLSERFVALAERFGQPLEYDYMAMGQFRLTNREPPLRASRIALRWGATSATSGVIGQKLPRFRLFGDTAACCKECAETTPGAAGDSS